MTLKDKVENNLVVFFLGSILTGFLAGIAAFWGTLAIAQLEIVQKGTKPPTGFNDAVDKDKIGQAFTSANGWKYKDFDGGKLAADELSLPNEQPRPEDIYATAPEANTILVWWKPSQSGFKYYYAQTGWNKHDPTTLVLPELSKHQVPIGLGGWRYQMFLYFQGTPPDH